MDIATSPAPQPSLPAWSAQEFEAQLRDKGAAYHIHHPFNVRMNAGGCTADELRCWVANRFYYQICIPRKDAAILANMPDRAHRRLWVERILDHDGQGDHQALFSADICSVHGQAGSPGPQGDEQPMGGMQHCPVCSVAGASFIASGGSTATLPRAPQGPPPSHHDSQPQRESKRLRPPAQGPPQATA